jgi:hypothetical protein
VAHVIEAYIAGWNETDPARRPELIERAWTPDATSLDPLMSGDGTLAEDGRLRGHGLFETAA